MEFKDQLGRIIKLSAGAPHRIVSLVPSQTELLSDLGVEDRILGITKFCIHPKHLRQNTVVVGGTKNPNINRIKSLEPDLILCNKEENTLEIVSALKETAPIHVSDIVSMVDVFNLIDTYGRMLGCETRATSLISEIDKERTNFNSRFVKDQRLKVVYIIWKDPWMVAGGDTFINTMLEEAGFINLFNDVKRYPQVSIDDPMLQKADLIFLSSEPYPFKLSHVIQLQKNFLNSRVKRVNGEYFSWYGSRIKKAYNYFETLLSQ